MNLHSGYRMRVQSLMMILRWLPWLPLGTLLAIISACAPSPAPAPQAMVSQPSTSARQEWIRELHRQLNDYRRAKGMPLLAYHTGLQKLCEDHSEWLRRKRGTSFASGSNVSHSGSAYRARIARIEHGMPFWGENVAYISHTPEDVATKLMIMWKASPSHDKAMLGNWTHVGHAIVVDNDGAIFATMNFGRTD